MAPKFTAASVHNKVTVEKNAQLHWMPQETILFENSNLSRSLIIDMHETSNCLLVEPLVFGRIASGERLNSAKIKDHIEIRKNGSIHFLEKLFLSNNITEYLSSATIANGANVTVLVVYIGSDAGSYFQWYDLCCPRLQVLPWCIKIPLLCELWLPTVMK